MRLSPLFVVAAALTASSVSAIPVLNRPSSTPLEVFVDCFTGSDAWGDGLRGNPLHSPMAARDMLRRMRPLGRPVVVEVSGDCFPVGLNFSQAVLELEAQDSGSQDAVITYRASKGGARLLGGFQVPFAAWEDAGGGLLALDISHLRNKIGGFVQNENPGGRPMGACFSRQMELFVDGAPQPLAGFPNRQADGSGGWMHVDHAWDANKSFSSSDPRVLKWAAEPDPWLHGYWGYDWADSYVPLSGVSQAVGGEAVLHVRGEVLYGLHPKARFRGVNLRCELDAPGEYYIHRANARLLYLPPGGAASLQGKEVFLSASDHTLLLGVSSTDLRAAERKMRGAWGARQVGLRTHERGLPPGSGGGRQRAGGGIEGSAHGASGGRQRAEALEGVMAFHNFEAEQMRVLLGVDESGGRGGVAYVAVEGFGVHFARVAGVKVVGGRDVALQDLRVTNIGGEGMVVDAVRSLISRVEVAYVGCTGVAISGGSYASLAPSRNVMRECDVHHVARTCRTYTPPLFWSGVGHLFKGNTFRDSPHAGALGIGNDCVWHANLFSDLAGEVDDSGAWYTSGGYVRRGHLLLGNTFLRVRSTAQTPLGFPHVMGIYMDDLASGVTILNNTFSDGDIGVLLGGGRDVHISGNVFTNLSTAIEIDDRGLSYEAYLCIFNGTEGAYAQALRAIHYQEAPYSKYPGMASTLSLEPCAPIGLRVGPDSFQGVAHAPVQVPGAVRADPNNFFAPPDAS